MAHQHFHFGRFRHGRTLTGGNSWENVFSKETCDDGDFKMIWVYETGTPRRFNIAMDPEERHDLAQEMPDKIKELDQRLTDHLAAVNVQSPKSDPDFDPGKVTGTKRKKERR